MRDYLNSILYFIKAESLTDEEFGHITLTVTTNQLANYNALHAVLVSRESVSVMIPRLQYYFLSQGVQVIPAPEAVSNIFAGAPLE